MPPKVSAKLLVCGEGATLDGRERGRLGLLDAARAHAHVRALDDDHHARSIRGLIDGIGNLLRQPLLHLQPARACVRHARELRQAKDTCLWQITHMAPSEKRQQVMLAQRVYPDIALRE